MKYALNLSEDYRILSSTFEEYATDNAVIVDTLPDGDNYDYRYIDGEYIYDPIVVPEQPESEPTVNDIINALLGVSE